jgi:transposase
MADIAVRGFVGIDWATEAHQACAMDPTGSVLWERSVPHSGQGLDSLCDWLGEIAAGSPSLVWVAIEVPHGAVVETLLERGFSVFSINPKQLDRFRDRFTVAGAKDDRLDARVLADSLRTDTPRFRRLQVDDPEVIELREWSRMAGEMKEERVRLCNRFREQLRRYFPQALQVTKDVGEEWFLSLWSLIPSPKTAKHVREITVRKLLRAHRIRKINASEVMNILRQPAVIVAPGTTEAATAHLHLLTQRIRLVNQHLRQCHERLDFLLEKYDKSGEETEDAGQKIEQRDATILRSLPGVGRIVLATLLSEASTPLGNRDYHTLRALCGVAPVTRQSGKRRIVSMRQACHSRLRDALYHWARVATQCDPISKERYAAFRQRGHSHGRALRGVGDRLIYVACTMLKSGTSFDENRQHSRGGFVAACVG